LTSALAHLLTAWVALQAGPSSKEQPLELSADQSMVDIGTHQLIASGQVRLRLRTMHIAAEHLTYDQKAGTGTASGGVVILDGDLAAWADEVSVESGSDHAVLKHAALFQKTGLGKVNPLDARSPSQLEAMGTNTLTLHGDELIRLGAKHYSVTHISFTPCRCKDETPDWRIDAGGADVIAGDRALLSWPVYFRVKGIPVLWLPGLWVPLSDRQTGFLLPRLTLRNGVAIDEPFFLTLGQSRDLTLEAGYMGMALPHETTGIREGARGPRVSAEYRYALGDGAEGKIHLVAIDDLNRDLNPDGTLMSQARGPRIALTATHIRDDGIFGERADIALYSDANLLSDYSAADVFTQSSDYLRSVASVFAKTGQGLAYVDVAYFQDLRIPPNTPLGSPLPLFGPNVPETLGRLPAFSLMQPIGNWGPIRAQVDASAVRYAPLELEQPALVDPDFHRPTATRLDLAPRLTFAESFGHWLDFEAYAAFREDGWILGTGDDLSRGYPFMGLTATTTLERVFDGPTRKIRHSIEPRLQLLYVPVVWGEGPLNPYDDVDLALAGACYAMTSSSPSTSAPCSDPTRVLQGVAALATDVDVADKGGRRWTVLSAEVGQDYDFGIHRLADTFGHLALDFGPLRANGTVRIDLRTPGVTYPRDAAKVEVVKASADVSGGPPALNAYVRYDHIDPQGSDQMRAGIDALFGFPLLTTPNSPGVISAPLFSTLPFDQVVAGITWGQLKWVTAHYELIVHPPPDATLIQQLASLSLRSACDCWRLDLTALWIPSLGVTGLKALEPIQFTASLTLAGLGGVGL
jgi:LPS-assembly protein